MSTHRTRKPLFPPPDVDIRPRWKRPVRIAALEHVLDDQDYDEDLRSRWKRSIPVITPEYDLDAQDFDLDQCLQNNSSSDVDAAALETDVEEAFWPVELAFLSKLTLPAVDVFNDSPSQQQRTHPLNSPPGLRAGHIRLLWIESSSKRGIHCTTRIVPLHERPSYTAISYTWGSPIALDRRYNITLDGHKLLLPRIFGGS